jgi:hypothetical protein
MTVIDEIADERKRQIESEGWTLEHDDKHLHGELARAGACYALHAAYPTANYKITPPDSRWPWTNTYDGSGGRGDTPIWCSRPAWWKPKNERRDLIRAAALIVAEIERLDRCK